MSRRITLTDRTARKLRDECRDGETRGDVVRRLLGESKEDTETERLARSCLLGSEIHIIEHERATAPEYLFRELDIDIEDYDDRKELLAAVRTKRRETA